MEPQEEGVARYQKAFKLNIIELEQIKDSLRDRNDACNQNVDEITTRLHEKNI